MLVRGLDYTMRTPHQRKGRVIAGAQPASIGKEHRVQYAKESSDESVR